MAGNHFSAPAPMARQIRGYFAPVNRNTLAPTIFDATAQGRFDLDVPPAPWVDLGGIQEFVRKPASKASPVLTGIPAATREQLRETLAAEVSFQFQRWTKLTMALATGSQHMNLLASQSGATQAATGAAAIQAVEVREGSTASVLVLSSADSSQFTAGSMIAVDIDYAGQIGFVGSPYAGAYVRKAADDVDYIRRVTFNVGLVSQVSTTSLTLAVPLPAGDPVPGAKLQVVAGFVDREGGSFYHEWSGLFVVEGSQGDRVFFHYPRLQPVASAEELIQPLDERVQGGYAHVLLKGRFTALPVTDPFDGERVLCYRSYLPVSKALI
jgi:hypothetical protein